LLFCALSLPQGLLAAVAPVPPARAPIPRLAPERPPSRILPYLGASPLVPLPPRIVQTCPQIPGGVSIGLGEPSTAIYGSAYGENLGGGPGSVIAQSSAVLGTSCPSAVVGDGLPPPTLDISGAPNAATPYRVP
jgi:hypothetical protein